VRLEANIGKREFEMCFRGVRRGQRKKRRAPKGSWTKQERSEASAFKK